MIKNIHKILLFMFTTLALSASGMQVKVAELELLPNDTSRFLRRRCYAPKGFIDTGYGYVVRRTQNPEELLYIKQMRFLSTYFNAEEEHFLRPFYLGTSNQLLKKKYQRLRVRLTEIPKFAKYNKGVLQRIPFIDQISGLVARGKHASWYTDDQAQKVVWQEQARVARYTAACIVNLTRFARRQGLRFDEEDSMLVRGIHAHVTAQEQESYPGVQVRYKEAIDDLVIEPLTAFAYKCLQQSRVSIEKMINAAAIAMYKEMSIFSEKDITPPLFDRLSLLLKTLPISDQSSIKKAAFALFKESLSREGEGVCPLSQERTRQRVHAEILAHYSVCNPSLLFKNALSKKIYPKQGYYHFSDLIIGNSVTLRTLAAACTPVPVLTLLKKRGTMRKNNMAPARPLPLVLHMSANNMVNILVNRPFLQDDASFVNPRICDRLSLYSMVMRSAQAVELSAHQLTERSNAMTEYRQPQLEPFSATMQSFLRNFQS